MRCDFKLFEDDTSLFTEVGNASDAAADLKHDLELIKQWALQWRISLNPDPQKQAVEVLCSRKNIANDHPEIRLDNIPVIKVKELKHLIQSYPFLNIPMQLSLRREEALED